MQSGGQPWAAAPPAPSPGAVINEVLAWRLVGSLVWHTLAWICGYSAWSLITAWALHAGASPAAVPGLHLAATSTLLLLGALQLLVLLAHHRLLSSSEAPPLYVPALGLHSRGWAGLLISRVLLRTRTWQDLANVALLGVATSATAATSIYLLPRVHHPASSGALDLAFVATYGVCLGVLYTVEHLARCRDVVAHPLLHRHRLFQLRQRLPACVLPAVKVSCTALLLALLLSAARPSSLPALLAALEAASLCCWGWLAAHDVLDVIATEPLRLVDKLAGRPAGAGPAVVAALPRDPVRGVLLGLADSRGLVQDLALQELCWLAEGQAALPASWRAAVWADEGGRATWTPLAGCLVGEIRDWLTTLAAALSGAPADKAPASGMAKVQWNALALSSSTGTHGVSRAQDLAAWVIRAKFYKISFCLRALSALVAASRQEDVYGVVLMCPPTLGDVMLLLLSCVLATQAYTRTSAVPQSTSSQVLQRVLALTGPPAHPTLQQAEVCCQALEDLARGCAYRVVTAFGPSLLGTLSEATLKPAYGSPSELQALLSALLTYKE